MPNAEPLEIRLCDDAGMVSHERTMPNAFDPELTYLKQLNNLRARSGFLPTIEPFVCSGGAHLAGMAIRCTSPAHAIQPAVVVVVGARAAGAEPTEIPRHLRLAMLNATLAFERDDIGALATINEDIQQLVDAAIGHRNRHAAQMTAGRDAQIERLANENVRLAAGLLLLKRAVEDDANAEG